MLLFTINGFQFVDRYQKELSSYSSNTIEQWNKRGTIGTTVFQEPNPLSFCVEGRERTQPRGIQIWLHDSQNPLPRSQYGNYKLPYVNAIDWVFILKIIFGLFGIILCFDSICGERERGTLRLTCANSISRSKILLGKYLAAMIVLAIPLAIGSLLSLIIIMNLSSGFVLTGVELARIFLLIAFFMIYLSFIVLLSLVISSLSRQSVTSLLILLFLLILMVVIIPNTGGIIVDETVKTMSEYEMVQRQDAVLNENLKRLIEVDKQAKKGELNTAEEISQAYDTAFLQRCDNQRQIENEYLQSIVKKRRWAVDIAKISPSAVFQYASESLANSGSLREENFYRAAEDYWQVYEAYVREKVGEIIWYSRGGGTITRDDGKKIKVPGVFPKEYHHPYLVEHCSISSGACCILEV